MLVGLNCAHCGSENVFIKDSRPDPKKDCVVRRRICEDCGDRFVTVEVRRTEESSELLKVNKEHKEFVGAIWARTHALLECPSIDSNNKYHDQYFKDIGGIYEMANEAWKKCQK